MLYFLSDYITVTSRIQDTRGGRGLSDYLSLLSHSEKLLKLPKLS